MNKLLHDDLTPKRCDECEWSVSVRDRQTDRQTGGHQHR